MHPPSAAAVTPHKRWVQAKGNADEIAKKPKSSMEAKVLLTCAFDRKMQETREPCVSPRLGGMWVAFPSTSIVSNRGKFDISSRVRALSSHEENAELAMGIKLSARVAQA
eukprot:1193484-Prorocentrum_minimum.AAC.4